MKKLISVAILVTPQYFRWASVMMDTARGGIVKSC
jgi:hypothetical protein